MADAIEVVVQMAGADVPAGRLWSHRRRGAESATFLYLDGYLAHPNAYELDPSLPLRAGQHQTPRERATFGAFSDCAPDRWGRRLIARTERARAARMGDAERSFGEMEYLLGHETTLDRGHCGFAGRATTRTWRRRATGCDRSWSSPGCSEPLTVSNATRRARRS